MTLEQFFICAFFASPFLIAILLCWVLFSAGIAYLLTAIIAAAGAWIGRGWKESLDRDYRGRNWKWP